MIAKLLSAYGAWLTRTGRNARTAGTLTGRSTLARRSGDDHSDVFARVERAKQEWEATADSLSELICLVDKWGRILRANRTVETWGLGEVTGVAGRPLHELVHPHCQDQSCFLQDLLRQIEHWTHTSQVTEVEAYDPYLQRHVRASVRPVAGGLKVAPSSAVLVLRDVTAHKQAEMALQRYTERLQALNDIEQAILAAQSPEEIAEAALVHLRRLVPYRYGRVALLDLEHDVFQVLAVDANGGARMRPVGELARSVLQAGQGREPDQFFVVDDLVKLSDLSPIERQMRAEGIRAYMNAPLMADGEFIGSLALGSQGVAAFTPEHVEIVNEVADMLAIAAHQAQLLARLQRMNMHLEAALQAKGEMIQNVSHELRTPLAILSGYVELLQEGGLGPLNADQLEAMEVLHNQVRRLEYMVNRLLTLQTVNVEGLRKEPTDLTLLLQQILEIWRVRAAEAAVRLKLEVQPDLPLIKADDELLGQVFYNLLDNAIKYSPDGGQITIKAWTEDNKLLCAVSDEGVGIAPETLERVFERFFRVENGLTRTTGGLGIGLALCRKIVDAHGGRMWAESEGEGKGSTFVVALPCG